MTEVEYRAAVQRVLCAEAQCRWCVISGGSDGVVLEARATLVAAETDFDRLISQATLSERAMILMSWQSASGDPP